MEVGSKKEKKQIREWEGEIKKQKGRKKTFKIYDDKDT